MDDNVANLVNNTYKNIIEEFGPCTKHLVSAGRIYLKALHAMVAASKQYTEALSKIASLANNSTLNACSDIGSTLFSIVNVNQEILAQQSNTLKSLEFDFLEPMEIAAEKDTKLLGKEQKRFQQLYKGRREAYLKCISTLKKTRKKKNVNTDKQLSHMKMLESAKERLETFCNESLKEALIQERVMYGSVLERQCALNRQFLIYHSKGCEILEEQLPEWKSIAETRDKLPEEFLSPIKNGANTLPTNRENPYALDSMLDVVIRNNSIARCYGRKDVTSLCSQTLRLSSNQDNIYARPLIRAKSEYCLPTSSSSSPKSESVHKRYSKVVDYNSEEESVYARALYAFEPNEDHQLRLREGDEIEYISQDNSTGWQFGDNLSTGNSGWFPVAYTEQIKDPSKYLYKNEDYEPKHPPPPTPATIGSVRSKMNGYSFNEGSEYATLTRTSKRLLPVEPPTVNSDFKIVNGENGTLKSKQYASHPDILEHSVAHNSQIYHGGHLQSMKL